MKIQLCEYLKCKAATTKLGLTILSEASQHHIDLRSHKKGNKIRP